MDQRAEPAGSEAGAARRSVTIRNQRGLHARAAAKFVKLADLFDAEVTVRKGDMSVSGRSIMGLMMLAAAPGTTIRVSALGPDADAAIAAITELVESKFNEEGT
jgi:phosphocarrier protein HPr